MVSALTCMVIHWIELTLSHGIRLSSGRDFTKLFHCAVFQTCENIELMLKLAVA